MRPLIPMSIDRSCLIRIPAPRKALRWARARTLLPIALFLTAALSSGAEAAARDILIASRDTNSIKRYDGVNGAYKQNFVKVNTSGLLQPQDMLWGDDGHLLVTGFQNSHILKFHGATGDSLGNFSSGYLLSGPTKMRVGPDGLLYVTQWGGSQRVVRFDRTTGVFIDQFTTSIVNACDMTWDAAGNLYVANWDTDGLTGRVRKFDPDGNLLGFADEAGHLLGPVNVWIDAATQHLFVLDWTAGDVEEFDETGAYEGQFLGGLSRAEGFVFGPDGMLYVCDWLLNQVNRYFPDGTFNTVFLPANYGNMKVPNAIIFFPEIQVDAPAVATGPGGMSGRLEQNFPNPFDLSTTIRFDAGRSGPATIDVFDVSGALVRTLVAGGTGSGEVRWNGRDRDGRRVANGVYHYRLKTPEGTTSRRMVLVR